MGIMLAMSAVAAAQEEDVCDILLDLAAGGSQGQRQQHADNFGRPKGG